MSSMNLTSMNTPRGYDNPMDNSFANESNFGGGFESHRSSFNLGTE